MRFKTPTSISTILDHLGPLADSHIGSTEAQVTTFTSLEKTVEKAFIFILADKFLDTAIKSEALCIVAPVTLKEKIEANSAEKTWIFSKNPELAARQVKTEFVLSTPFKNNQKGIHTTAIVPKSCDLGKGVTISPNVVVGENCKIGNNVYIGANTYVEENVVIGNNTTLHPFVYIGHSCLIGNDCEIKPQATIGSEGFGYAHDHLGNHYRVPHTGRVVLEDGVHIGAGTAIDRGTIGDSHIGKGTKIDNQCHLAHNTIIGKNGLLTAQLVMAGSTTIGNNFMCGGQTAITGHISITDNVQLAGRSVVAKSITKPGAYGGYPLEPLKDFLRSTKNISQLTKMRKQLSKLMKHSFPNEK